MSTAVYHPDPAINAEIIEQSTEAERTDLAIGYPPRAWTCVCGVTHNRGHFLTIGTHRCLSCGYVGTEGVMHGSSLGGAHDPALLGRNPTPLPPMPPLHTARRTNEES